MMDDKDVVVVADEGFPRKEDRNAETPNLLLPPPPPLASNNSIMISDIRLDTTGKRMRNAMPNHNHQSLLLPIIYESDGNESSS